MIGPAVAPARSSEPQPWGLWIGTGLLLLLVVLVIAYPLLSPVDLQAIKAAGVTSDKYNLLTISTTEDELLGIGGENAAAQAFHERLGFRKEGHLTGVGFKFGRWVDSVFMQRHLGRGDSTHP